MSPPMELGYDSQPLSSLAKKVPKLVRSGNPELDHQRHVERTCLVRIIDQLIKEPSRIMPTHAYMLAHNPSASPQVKSRKQWSGSYTVLSQMPTGWMIEFIKSRAEEEGVNTITDGLLAALDNDDSENIPTIFSCITQLPLSLGFPAELKDAFVAKATFHKRCDQVGNRLKYMVASGGISLQGKLNMKLAGPFILEFKEDECVLIKHCCGSTAVPSKDVPISKQFLLMDNILDAKAKVVKKPRNDLLHEFFDQDSEFLRHMWKPHKKFAGLKELASEASAQAREIDTERAAASTCNVDALQPAAKKRAANATERARKCLQAAAEKRQRKRTIVL